MGKNRYVEFSVKKHIMNHINQTENEHIIVEEEYKNSVDNFNNSLKDFIDETYETKTENIEFYTNLSEYIQYEFIEYIKSVRSRTEYRDYPSIVDYIDKKLSVILDKIFKSIRSAFLSPMETMTDDIKHALTAYIFDILYAAFKKYSYLENLNKY